MSATSSSELSRILASYRNLLRIQRKVFGPDKRARAIALSATRAEYLKPLENTPSSPATKTNSEPTTTQSNVSVNNFSATVSTTTTTATSNAQPEISRSELLKSRLDGAKEAADFILQNVMQVEIVKGENDESKLVAKVSEHHEMFDDMTWPKHKCC